MSTLFTAEWQLLLLLVPVIAAFGLRFLMQLETTYIKDPALRSYINEMVVAAAQTFPYAERSKCFGWVLQKVTDQFPKQDQSKVSALIQKGYHDVKSELKWVTPPVVTPPVSVAQPAVTVVLPDNTAAAAVAPAPLP